MTLILIDLKLSMRQSSQTEYYGAVLNLDSIFGHSGRADTPRCSVMCRDRFSMPTLGTTKNHLRVCKGGVLLIFAINK